MNKNIIKTVKLSFIITSLCVVVYFYKIRSNYCTTELLDKALNQGDYRKIITCANKGVTDAMISLCDLHIEGKGVEKNYEKAINLCMQAAEQKDSLAMIKLGNIYSGISPRDYNKALEWYQSALDQKDDNYPKAMYELSKYYRVKFWHHNDNKDLKLFIDCLEKAVNMGYIPAIHDMATEYQEGNLFPKNYQKSKKLIEKASTLEDVLAYRRMGNMYANGFLGNADYEKAAFWYKKAADEGDIPAQDCLKQNPSPFGLEITKATIDDFKKLFPHHKKFSHPNIYNNGIMYSVSPKYIALDGIISDVLFIFNTNNVLEAVSIDLSVNQKYEIQNSLKSKYTSFMSSPNMYDAGNSTIRLHEYESGFKSSPYRYDSSYIKLVYMSRAFSILVYKYDSAIEEKKNKYKESQRKLL